MSFEFFFGVVFIFGALIMLVQTIPAPPPRSKPKKPPVTQGVSSGYQLIYPVARDLAMLPFPHWNAMETMLAKALLRAGWTPYFTPREYIALQMTLAIIGFLGALLFLCLNPIKLLPIFPLLVIGFVAAGYFVPLLKLNDAGKRRIKSIRLELPYMLDLLTVSVEAGLEFTQALSRIVAGAQKSPLIEELEKTLHQISLGTPRVNALEDLAERVNIDEVKGLVALLVQAYMMGSSLGPSLRAQSSVMRTRRMQTAEKKAQEAPVKMLFPLLVFILPVVFVFILGPVILELLNITKGLN